MSRFGLSAWCFLISLFGSCLSTLALAQSQPSADAKFFRGLNLNGPALTIQGQQWEGAEAAWYECRDKAFENQSVELVPPTDESTARMIRSSRWGGNRILIRDLPEGDYTLFLYVWEDNQSETYSISLNGRQVALNYQSGDKGHWDRLGPWFVRPRQGTIELASKGGAANFSGIEIWSGYHDGIQETYTPEQLAFFEQRIRPVLMEHCYECHSQESDEPGAGLLVDSRASLRQGAKSGPGVIPGKPQEGSVFAALKYHDNGAQMPPDGRLEESIIADFEHWIATGAADPRATATKHQGKKINLEEARTFWSLLPLQRPELPPVSNEKWVKNDIDRFVLAQMETQELSPAAPAAKSALLRRASYDLTGLPPTPEELVMFFADESPDAFEHQLDRLLASPRYGERWARHWMDVIRYADTAGDNSDFPIPQMRLYRDWIIDALNQDMPYDEFIRSQLAGDLLESESESLRQSRIVATGYIANARRFGSRVDDYPQHLTIEDTLDNLGRSLLGITLSCARCHDHKFDPVTTKDYYGLYGIFSSTRYPWPGIELEQRQRDLVPLVPLDAWPQKKQEADELKKQYEEAEKKVREIKADLEKLSDEEKSDAEKDLKLAEEEFNRIRSLPKLFQSAYAVTEAEECVDAAVQLKGDPTKLGDVVERRFFTVLGGQSLPKDFKGSGRDKLVDWLFAADNPLPPRVIANRLWQYHFGKGIVATPNDFGKQGIPPTHPQLLDYLAIQLKEGGWSFKQMHKKIMLSATYQQSVARNESSIEKDPANKYLSSFPSLRLDAESLRDTLLFVGGNLELQRPGEHPFPHESTWKFTQHNPFKAVYESNHRSLFLMTQRIQRHPYLAIFDGADPSTSTASRMITTTPIQSLFLLNNSLVHEQAERMAQRAIESNADDTSAIDWTYQTLFARKATSEEVASGRHYLDRVQTILESSVSDANNRKTQAWQSFIRMLFRLNEFVYLD